MTVSRNELITLLKKMSSKLNWEDTNQNDGWLNGQLVSEPLNSYRVAHLHKNTLEQALGPNVRVKIKILAKGEFSISVDTKSLTQEYNLRNNKIKDLTESIAQKREGVEARVPPILNRGGKAQGFLQRDAYMLTQHQVNFVRKMQLEQVFRKKEQSIATNILLSHENYPSIFAVNDPTILIGDQGEAIMLCKQQPLGEGGLGSVYIGQQLDTGDFCVIKSLHQVTPNSVSDFKKENQTLEELNLLIDTMHVVDNGKEKLYSVQELAWGKDYYKFLGIETGDQQKVPTLKKLDMFIKALEKIHTMHEKDGKLHRDIKVENIVWDEKSSMAKLVDVGFTESMQSGEVEGSLVGTPAYIAPELIKSYYLGETCIYNEKTEMYAAGVLGCEMFSADSLSITFDEIESNLIDSSKNQFLSDGLTHSLSKADLFQDHPNWSETTCDLFNMLSFMVDINEEKRPNFEDSIAILKEIQQRMQLELGNFNQVLAKKDEIKEPQAKRYIEQLDEKIQQNLTKRDPVKTAENAESESIKAKLMALERYCHDKSSTQPNDNIENLQKFIGKMALQDKVDLSDLKKLTQQCITASTNEKMKHLTSRSRVKGSVSESQKLLDSILTEVNSILKSTPEYQAGLEKTLLQRKRASKKTPPKPVLQTNVSRPRADANAPPPLPSLPSLPTQNTTLDAQRLRAKGHTPPKIEKGLMQEHFNAKQVIEKNTLSSEENQEKTKRTISPGPKKNN